VPILTIGHVTESHDRNPTSRSPRDTIEKSVESFGRGVAFLNNFHLPSEKDLTKPPYLIPEFLYSTTKPIFLASAKSPFPAPISITTSSTRRDCTVIVVFVVNVSIYALEKYLLADPSVYVLVTEGIILPVIDVRSIAS
jgi:hypothetical protein